MKKVWTILTSLWTFYPLISAYFALPKMPDWKDFNAFYDWLKVLVYSEFLQILTDKTPFYLDNYLLSKVQAGIANKEQLEWMHGVIISGGTTSAVIPQGLWDTYNFLNTVMCNRWLFRG